LEGRRVTETVELVDVMPTLADIAGLPKATANTSVLDGQSLLPLLLNLNPNASVKANNGWQVKPAFSQYPRRAKDADKQWAHNGIDHVPR